MENKVINLISNFHQSSKDEPKISDIKFISTIDKFRDKIYNLKCQYFSKNNYDKKFDDSINTTKQIINKIHYDNIFEKSLSNP
jgi:hypothetical protein